MPALCLLCCLLALRSADADPIRYYLPLTQEQAGQISEIGNDDVQLFLEGQPHPVLKTLLIGPSTPGPEATRLFIIHIDRRLSFREDFRSRRWVKKFLRHLDLKRDLVAVHRAGALSQFSSNLIEIERLVDYFGTEFDRFDFGPRQARNRRWLQNSLRPFGPHYANSSGDQKAGNPRSLLSRQVRGDIRDSLSVLRSLPGRKILLHFGKTLPFLPDQVEFHDPKSSIRWALEIGLNCYAIVPQDGSREKSADPALKTWVEETGGRLLFESRQLPQDLETILADTSYSLLVEFDPPRKYAGGFHPYRLRVEIPLETLEGRGGYFDLVETDAPIHERAFLTVGLQDPPGSEPPLHLEAKPAEFRGLIVELSFPLEQVRFEVIEGAPGGERRIFQEVHIFLGLYGEQDQLLDFAQDKFDLDLGSDEVKQFFPRNATLKRVLESRTLAEPTRVRAIVVVGQGRQISGQELSLP